MSRAKRMLLRLALVSAATLAGTNIFLSLRVADKADVASPRSLRILEKGYYFESSTASSRNAAPRLGSGKENRILIKPQIFIHEVPSGPDVDLSKPTTTMADVLLVKANTEVNGKEERKLKNKAEQKMTTDSSPRTNSSTSNSSKTFLTAGAIATDNATIYHESTTDKSIISLNTAVVKEDQGRTKDEKISNMKPEKEEHKFAYTFLIAGIYPERSRNHRGYFYNIVVANRLLEKFGSKADVICLIRMHEQSKYDKLRPKEERILTKSGIIVKYLPKPLSDNFHTAMMDKFRILELTEYDRVLYLDADVMPLNNLDYLFEMSVGPDAPLAENLAVAYHNEPANGGFFMLKPCKEDYVEITKIIERREREGYDFNETLGWGHVITPPDYWESLKVPNGTKWNFYSAFTDQGLLFYWIKYVKKNVSLFTPEHINTWGANKDEKPQLIHSVPPKELFQHVEKKSQVCANHEITHLESTPPYRDFHHFKSKSKPWLFSKHRTTYPKLNELWFQTLHELNDKYGFSIDFDRFGYGTPILGLYPAYSMVEETKKKHLEKSVAKVSKN